MAFHHKPMLWRRRWTSDTPSKPAIIRSTEDGESPNKSPSKKQILDAWTLTSINQVRLNVAQRRRGGPATWPMLFFNCNNSIIDHSFQQQLIQA